MGDINFKSKWFYASVLYATSIGAFLGHFGNEVVHDVYNMSQHIGERVPKQGEVLKEVLLVHGFAPPLSAVTDNPKIGSLGYLVKDNGTGESYIIHPKGDIANPGDQIKYDVPYYDIVRTVEVEYEGEFLQPAVLNARNVEKIVLE